MAMFTDIKKPPLAGWYFGGGAAICELAEPAMRMELLQLPDRVTRAKPQAR